MSDDINVQSFSGKVNITSNLLVGSSHLFVDTTNNRVGLVTNNPDSGLHVNSNAYVNTDFRVGSDIVMNEVAGRITADSFVGNGSGLTSISSDSGSWVNGANSNVHLATSTNKVGIGVTDPQGGLHVQTDNRVHITAGTVSAFTGLSTSSSTGTSRAQLVLNSRYSDLVIASSYVNSNHGSTLTFATVNPSNTAEYRKFVINQGNWGSRKDFLDFGLSVPDGVPRPNPHSSINSTDTVLTLDGNNKRVGIGTMSPDTDLHVNGVIKQTGASWALTNTGVSYNAYRGATSPGYAFLNRTLSTPVNVTLTHESQGTTTSHNSKSRITVGVGGKYAMYINGFKQTGTNELNYELQLIKNGSYVNVRAFTGQRQYGQQYQTIGSAYTIMDLNANDYVEVYIHTGTFHSNNSIYFAGHLIA